MKLKNKMKTIEQAALEYAEPIASDLSHKSMDDLNICDLEDCIAESFKAGVEFAQRWIPIEEEEPPLYITVLVKLFNGRYFTAKYIKSSKCREDDVWSDGFSYYPVNDTHWRPINIK